MSKNDIINDYIKKYWSKLGEEASRLLFPSSRMRSVNIAGVDSVSYVRQQVLFKDDTLYAYVPEMQASLFLLFCKVSKSGWFRGIKRIIYAGYNAGDLVFSGISTRIAS